LLSFHRVFLPSLTSPSKQHFYNCNLLAKKTIFFDLDETLIHTLTEQESDVKPDITLKMLIPNEGKYFTVIFIFRQNSYFPGKNLYQAECDFSSKRAKTPELWDNSLHRIWEILLWGDYSIFGPEKWDFWPSIL